MPYEYPQTYKIHKIPSFQFIKELRVAPQKRFF